MDKEKVLAQLSWAEKVTKERIYCGHKFVSAIRRDGRVLADFICLDSDFSVEDLRAIVWWYDHPEAFD